MNIGSLLGAIGQGFIWGIMTLGIFITYKILNVSDLTVDGSFATGGCIFAVTSLAGIHPTLCLGIAMIVGGVCGLVTGILHTKFKIPAILAGILTQLGLYSVNLRILGDKANVSISQVSTNITFLSKLLNIPHTRAGMFLGIIISLICILLLYFLLGTEFGASIRATGNNEKMIRALGVNTDNIKLFGMILSNMLIGLSGALLVQMNKYADVGMGKGVGLKANDMQLLSAIIVVIALAMPIFKENLNVRKVGKINSLNEMKQMSNADQLTKDKLDKRNVTEVGGGENA